MIMTIIRLKRQEIIYHVVIYLASIFNQPFDIMISSSTVSGLQPVFDRLAHSLNPRWDNDPCPSVRLKKVIQKLYNKVYRYRDKAKQSSVLLS